LCERSWIAIQNKAVCIRVAPKHRQSQIPGHVVRDEISPLDEGLSVATQGCLPADVIAEMFA
jgi:hypothetical protein